MPDRGTLRRSVGRNLGALSPVALEVRTESTFAHDYPPAWGADKVGNRVYYKGHEAQVRMADGQTLSIAPSVFPDVTVGDSAELWAPPWSPSVINQFINNAIIESVRKVYLDIDPMIQCVTARNLEFEMPAEWAMVNDVYGRESFDFDEVYRNAAWVDPAGSAQIGLDYADYRYQPSTRIDSFGSMLQATIGPRDLSGMTHLEGWFKANTTYELEIDLKEGEVVRETLTFPLQADKWLWLRKPLTTAQALMGVDNVVAWPEMGTVWLNGLWAINDDSIYWKRIDRRAWRVDRNTRRMVIRPRYLYMWGRNYAGRSVQQAYTWPVEDVMQIIGGKDPEALNDDADETEVAEQFLIARATQLAYSTVSGGPQTDPRRFRQLAVVWEAQAQSALARFDPLVNVRRLGGSPTAATPTPTPTPTPITVRVRVTFGYADTADGAIVIAQTANLNLGERGEIDFPATVADKFVVMTIPTGHRFTSVRSNVFPDIESIDDFTSSDGGLRLSQGPIRSSGDALGLLVTVESTEL